MTCAYYSYSVFFFRQCFHGCVSSDLISSLIMASRRRGNNRRRNARPARFCVRACKFHIFFSQSRLVRILRTVSRRPYGPDVRCVRSTVEIPITTTRRRVVSAHLDAIRAHTRIYYVPPTCARRGGERYLGRTMRAINNRPIKHFITRAV